VLARVEGGVVATEKNPKMTGSKLLVVRPLVIEKFRRMHKRGSSRVAATTLVAVDSLGAGEGTASSLFGQFRAACGGWQGARRSMLSVTGIVDTVDLGKTILYKVQ